AQIETNSFDPVCFHLLRIKGSKLGPIGHPKLDRAGTKAVFVANKYRALVKLHATSFHQTAQAASIKPLFFLAEHIDHNNFLGLFLCRTRVLAGSTRSFFSKFLAAAAMDCTRLEVSTASSTTALLGCSMGSTSVSWVSATLTAFGNRGLVAVA